MVVSLFYVLACCVAERISHYKPWGSKKVPRLLLPARQGGNDMPFAHSGFRRAS